MSDLDMNYTDLTTNGGIPLCQNWERIAMKELCDIAHYLTHGLFTGPQDFSDRLTQAAGMIDEMLQVHIEEVGVIPPSSRPEVPIAWVANEPVYGGERQPNP